MREGRSGGWRRSRRSRRRKVAHLQDSPQAARPARIGWRRSAARCRRRARCRGAPGRSGSGPEEDAAGVGEAGGRGAACARSASKASAGARSSGWSGSSAQARWLMTSAVEGCRAGPAPRERIDLIAGMPSRFMPVSTWMAAGSRGARPRSRRPSRTSARLVSTGRKSKRGRWSQVPAAGRRARRWSRSGCTARSASASSSVATKKVLQPPPPAPGQLGQAQAVGVGLDHAGAFGAGAERRASARQLAASAPDRR